MEVSNQMAAHEKLFNYPYWLGNQERLENNQRYVYELNYDAEKKQIIYTKYQYNNQEIIEQFIFDGLTGEELSSIAA